MSKFSVYPVSSRHIGSSSTWLGELIQQMRESDDTSLDVPCGTCNACCHGPPTTITDEDLARFPYQTAVNERGQRQLVQTEDDGGCVYLDDEVRHPYEQAQHLSGVRLPGVRTFPPMRVGGVG